MNPPPLAGRRVVVTRAREQAADLCARLEALGAQPLLFPTITFRLADDPAPLRQAAGTLEPGDWIVFTSATAVRAVRDLLARGGEAAIPAGIGLPAGSRVAAVGPGTAAALQEHGVTADAVPAEHRGERIAEALGGLTGRRVLLPRADVAREAAAEALRARGARVHTVVAYHTLPARPDPDALATLERGVDAVTFTSPSTARHFVALLGEAPARRVLQAAVIATIGPVTSEAVRALGFAVHVEPAEATTAALAAALAAHFARAPEGVA